ADARHRADVVRLILRARHRPQHLAAAHLRAGDRAAAGIDDLAGDAAAALYLDRADVGRLAGLDLDVALHAPGEVGAAEGHVVRAGREIDQRERAVGVRRRRRLVADRDRRE